MSFIPSKATRPQSYVSDFDSDKNGNRYASDSEDEFQEWLADVRAPVDGLPLDGPSLENPSFDNRTILGEIRAPLETGPHLKVESQALDLRRARPTDPLIPPTPPANNPALQPVLEIETAKPPPETSRLGQLTGITSPLALGVSAPTNNSVSVNSSEHRLDTAFLHLRTMDLEPDATWSQIMARYREIMTTLDAADATSSGARQNIRKCRRNVNISYACLRLLSGRRSR